MNDNHPVLLALQAQLRDVRHQYRQQPSEFNRYQLVRQEQRLAQWAPAAAPVA